MWRVSNRRSGFDRVNEARKTLATILGGIVLLAGFFGTWQNLNVAQESASTSQKALLVSEEGQITDRFTKAIEQLGATDNTGSMKMEVRLGGIYSLEAIANESKSFHWPIMEALCTYVKLNTTKQAKPTDATKAIDDFAHPSADIQAIMTVLSRRDRTFESQNKDLNLDDAHLSGVALFGGNLSGMELGGADLSRAYLPGASLNRAFLVNANLSKAALAGADLRNTNLNGADLSGAYLGSAFVYGGENGIRFGGADVRGVDLSQVRGLTQEQVDKAIGDSRTQLPANLHMPDSWKK
jgi:uncharacterized protein YjbI with pentapeptide repeats